MGMVGSVFIRPALNQNGNKYAYNDPATRYDREYTFALNEVWAEAHWCDSHIQLPEWTDYKPEFFLMNGRVYPDTIAPAGRGTDLTTGDLIPPVDRDGTTVRWDLQYQPISSLIRCKEGEKVLLRISNLGFLEQSLAISGIKMQIVGHDAMLLRGRDGTDQMYFTNTIAIETGESIDAIFTAPEHSTGTGSAPDRYLLYNTQPSRVTNAGYQGYGGQMTEIWVYPSNYNLPAQENPNE